MYIIYVPPLTKHLSSICLPTPTPSTPRTVANPVLTFFVVWLAWRFGDIKLGPKGAEPEFSNVSYFAMIFSAGVGVGLFFFGVAEPLWHQNSHYYAEAGYHSQNEIDQWALVITMYHWGFAAWSPCKFIHESVLHLYMHDCMSS